MKTRTAFVGNSSSSSFAVWGWCIEKKNLNEYRSKGFYEFTEEEQKEELENRFSDYVGWRAFNEDCGSTLVLQDEFVYIGFYPRAMKDEETLLDFKRRIASYYSQELIEAGLDNTLKIEDIDFFSGEIYD